MPVRYVIACSGDAYPELADKQDYIFKILSTEENAFYKTIDKGMEILKADIEEIQKRHSPRKLFAVLWEFHCKPFPLRPCSWISRGRNVRVPSAPSFLPKMDHGTIRTATGTVTVTDCVKVVGGKTAHMGTVADGTIALTEPSRLFHEPRRSAFPPQKSRSLRKQLH